MVEGLYHGGDFRMLDCVNERRRDLRNEVGLGVVEAETEYNQDNKRPFFVGQIFLENLVDHVHLLQL